MSRSAPCLADHLCGVQVHFGSTVTIARDDGRRQTFRIVGEDEAEPTRGTPSYVTPLARAQIGKEVGDVVPMARPRRRSSRSSDEPVEQK